MTRLAATSVLTAAAGLVACGGPAQDGAGPAGRLDGEYDIGGMRVRLAGGVSEVEAAPGSATRIVTRYFGNEVRKDLDGDGSEDVAFLVTQEAGGSGTFFYVVAALDTASGHRGSQGLLLGDRIAPRSTEPGPGRTIIVNYADRPVGDSFAEPPSVNESLRLLLNPTTLQFGEVAGDFEGEADPGRMTLDMKTWRWIRASLEDGTEVRPRREDAFSIAFAADGRFSATTDCNSVSGGYSTDGRRISFGPAASTRMYCEASQESEFTSLLYSAEEYGFNSRGELLLTLSNGSLVFR